jgi:hypothetical protein
MADNFYTIFGRPATDDRHSYLPGEEYIIVPCFPAISPVSAMLLLDTDLSLRAAATKILESSHGVNSGPYYIDYFLFGPAEKGRFFADLGRSRLYDPWGKRFAKSFYVTTVFVASGFWKVLLDKGNTVYSTPLNHAFTSQI